MRTKGEVRSIHIDSRRPGGTATTRRPHCTGQHEVLSYGFRGGTFFLATCRHTDLWAANGGLRVTADATPAEAQAESEALACLMSDKHRLYGTGFCGAKLVVPGAPDRRALLDAVAYALQDLRGAVLTGCDMGTGLDDMRDLGSTTPHVLSCLDLPVDSNHATAYGVVGAIEATLPALSLKLSAARVLVHGTGKVGAAVARILAAAGATVYTHDLQAEAARIHGCIPVEDWESVGCDILSPCSGAGLIDPTLAGRIRCGAIVGAANRVLADEVRTAQILAARGILFIPEALSSAGAVICDSIEHYARHELRSASPGAAYGFVQHLVRAKVEGTIERIERTRELPLQAIPHLFEPPTAIPCGQAFRAERTSG